MGRRSWTSGTREPSRAFPSGSANDLGRRLELRILLRVRRTRLKVPLPRRFTKRKRMRKNTMRKKSNVDINHHSNVCSSNEKKSIISEKKKKKKKKKTTPKKKKKKKKKKS